MVIGLVLIIINFIYICLLNLVFYSKERTKNMETRIYSILLSGSIIGLILEFLCCFTVSGIISNVILKIIVNKLFLLFILSWVFLFARYIIEISFENSKNGLLDLIKKLLFKNKIYYIIYLIFFISILVLPINYFFDGNYVYSYGKAIDITMFSVGFYLLLMFFCCLLNFKNISRKKTSPMFAFILLIAITMIVRSINPGLLVINAVIDILSVMMYFTIENPDVKMLEKLEVSKEEAEKANRAKTDFLSSMSHEIRTPLNAIVGFSECIINTDDINEAHEDANDVVKASHTLLEIVNGILDISKIEAGKLEIVNSSYNSIELFNNVAKLVTPRMEEKALDFQISIANDIPKTLYGDHANVKKVITNVLGNASKYTETGFVKYDVRCINNKNVCRLVISIEDSGRGIKQENIDKLFNKFQRLDEDRNTTIEGTGLGLAITKQLVEMMGGKVIVQSVYGKGSKFTIILDQRIERVEEKPKLAEVINTNINIDLTGKKILIVDDNPLNLKVAGKILSAYNPIIEDVESGFQCIDKVKSGIKYDMILLDDMMPKMSGIETLKELRKIKGFNIITIALTANAITGMREKYLEEGFDEYLAKPINKEELKKLLIKYLINNDRRVDFGNLPEDFYQIENNEDDSKEEVIKEKTPDVKPEVVEEVVTEVKEDIQPPVAENGIEYLKKNNIDIDYALSLLGDIDMYNDTVREFLKDIDERINKLSSFNESGDMENYAIAVHSLKSDSKYLGFMTLADIAYDQEMKSKANDKEYIKENYNKLTTELNNVLTIIKNYKY